MLFSDFYIMYVLHNLCALQNLSARLTDTIGKLFLDAKLKVTRVDAHQFSLVHSLNSYGPGPNNTSKLELLQPK